MKNVNLVNRERKSEFNDSYRRYYNKIVKNTFEKENLN
jgi:hypothetical protein